MSMSISDWTFYLSMEAARWLNTAVYLLGMCVAVWAFLRCRKRAYLVVGVYFALVLFAWHIWPPISHAIYVQHTPIEVQQRDEQQAREAHSTPAPYRINIQIAPMVLVCGLWLLARREPEHHRPNTALEPTPTAP
jgi:type II secretory pathway component PulM